MKNDVMKVLAIVLIGAILVAIAYLNGPGRNKGRSDDSQPPEGPQTAESSNPGTEGEKPTAPATGGGKTKPAPAATVRSVVRRPLEPEATKRLHGGPVIISSLFEASGKAEHRNYGKALLGGYLYVTTVIAESEVIDKKEDKKTGEVCVKERRRFLQARDNISLSDVDVVVALDTLPVDQVKTWVDNACTLVASACMTVADAAPPTAPFASTAGLGTKTIQAVLGTVFEVLQSIDGVSARGLLGDFGVTVPENIEMFVNEKISQWMKKKIGVKIQEIEGKSFILTYTQTANGQPLNVSSYQHEDGKPITEAEWEILRTANVFLDSNVVPDARCRVGDTWTVWADEAQGLFGAMGDGRAEGNIKVERVKDQPDGTWTLQVEPSEVTFVSKDDTARGKMQVKDGNGLVDAKNASVKSLQVTATGNLRSLNKKRHALFFDFVEKIEGDSNLRFTLKVDPAAGPSKK